MLLTNALMPKRRLGRAILAMTLLVVLLGGSRFVAADQLQQVRARDQLRCGLAEQAAGLAQQDAKGLWSGFDVDLCRALAAGIFGDSEKVAFRILAGDAAVAALGRGEVDLVARLPAWRASDAEGRDGRFVVPLLFDGQGFMVARKSYGGTLASLSESRLCVAGDRAGEALERLAGRRAWTFDILVRGSLEEAASAFFGGDCAAVSGSRLALARQRARRGATAEEFEILPDIVAPDPAGPFIAADMSAWLELVRWSAFALIEAEERGINSTNILKVRHSSADPAVRRFLGSSGSIGETLGLTPDWVVQMIAQVGNYGEIYARNLGEDAPLGLERGPNALWRDGGLLQAMPFQ